MSALRTIPKQSWLLAGFSGVLQVVIFPKPGWSALSWICLAPLLYALLNPPSIEVLSAAEDTLRDRPHALTIAQGFWLGYLSGIIWYAGSCYWIYRTMLLYGGLSPVMSAIVLFLFSCYLGLYHAAFGAFLARVSQKKMFAGARALLVAPFLWTAVELARSRITGFPWDPMGNAVVDNIPLTRLATITGVYGLSFVVATVNIIFAAIFLVPPARKRRFALAAVAVALILHAGVLVSPRDFSATHIARLVQQNLPIFEPGVWTAAFYEKTISEIVQVSGGTRVSGENLAQKGASPHLIIWPESPAPFYVNDPKFRDSVSRLASAKDAFVIAGSLGLESPQSSEEKTRVFNSAALVGPSGAFLARYDKIHLVPFGEYVPFQSLLFFAEKLTREVGTFSRGKQRNVFTLSRQGLSPETMDHMRHGEMAPSPAVVTSNSGAGANTAGVFICYESVFPDEVRRFALNGAQVFVNISNDGWYGDSSAPLQLLDMSRMRSIESGRWLLRATNTGITSSIDPYGRVVARAERNVRTVLDAPYAFVSGTTFYTRHGDWFAYGCAIISLAAVFVRFNLRAAVLRST